MEQERGAVSQQGVSLHLPEANAPLDVPPSHRLVGHLVPRSCRPHLELVGDHVTQPLVVNHPDEDVGFQLLAAQAAVEALRAIVVVPAGSEHFAKVLQGGVVLREGEGRGVVAEAVQGAGLPGHALDQHPDGHAGREAMGVEQDVGAHAALGEGHVLGGPQATQDALLAVAASELVPDGGVARHSHGDTDVFEAARAAVVAAHLDVVHHAGLLAPGRKQGHI